MNRLWFVLAVIFLMAFALKARAADLPGYPPVLDAAEIYREAPGGWYGHRPVYPYPRQPHRRVWPPVGVYGGDADYDDDGCLHRWWNGYQYVYRRVC